MLRCPYAALLQASARPSSPWRRPWPPRSRPRSRTGRGRRARGRGRGSAPPRSIASSAAATMTSWEPRSTITMTSPLFRRRPRAGLHRPGQHVRERVVAHDRQIAEAGEHLFGGGPRREPPEPDHSTPSRGFARAGPPTYRRARRRGVRADHRDSSGPRTPATPVSAPPWALLGASRKRRRPPAGARATSQDIATASKSAARRIGSHPFFISDLFVAGIVSPRRPRSIQLKCRRLWTRLRA